MLLAVLSLMRGFLHLPLLFAITNNMMMIVLNVAFMPFSMTSDMEPKELNCKMRIERKTSAGYREGSIRKGFGSGFLPR